MAALTADRNTPMQSGWRIYEFTPGVGAVIFRGALCGIDAAGALHAAGSAAGLLTVGCAEHGTASVIAPQALGGGTLPASIVIAGGRTTVRVRQNTLFALDNAAGADALGPADWGKPCYVLDDHTVAKTDGGQARALAGTYRGATQVGGAWVQV